ncbi:MAG: hypothetical protein KJ067_10850 [Vicinamibacteria bacterium]|nr:hypothetical protein [Vicinamibacteria bacterium]
MSDTCPECGEPMERADDFWYCDNPECPRGRAAGREKAGRPGALPSPPGPPREPARREGR